ncbi:Hsp20/alpha crystallin family protein [Kribbella sp.]|uniref:Hsp20/alpha crystallin family protein n=1 Tax=Kribbella sp. TaxID=1871183 RepID=UPI002D2DB4FB|nr:Hsp20/alpha crystallin family protein [Kribbella sp.]HZX02823.1 Hsp20/alpha crystallin family protein [Kribbella sp.]
MMIRTDPFQVVDQLTRQLTSPWAGPNAMPMDAYRSGEDFVISFDLPGVEAEAIDVNVERNVLTIKAERPGLTAGDEGQVQISERPHGTFTRQVILGENLDTDHIDASYEAGVLRLRIPVAEQAKPRRIEIRGVDRPQISA